MKEEWIGQLITNIQWMKQKLFNQNIFSLKIWIVVKEAKLTSHQFLTTKGLSPSLEYIFINIHV